MDNNWVQSNVKFGFSAFQEPRGVMRILEIIFSICAMATIKGCSLTITFLCAQDKSIDINFPFRTVEQLNLMGNCTAKLQNDVSSDPQYLHTFSIICLVAAILLVIVYSLTDGLYSSNKTLYTLDFIITLMFAVVWIGISSAWANSLSILKDITENPIYSPPNCCTSTTSSFSTFNISVIFGFLNFFLWGSNLWFIYKEMPWFAARQQSTSGV